MRNLVLALVLANLVFAAWRFWHGEPSVPPAPRAQGPALTLLKEVTPAVGGTGPAAAVEPAPEGAADVPGAAAPDAAASLAPPAAEPPGDPAAERCVSVGPFRELSQAATAAASLRAAGHEPTQRVAEGDIWVGYWVYLERIPTEGEANAILANLRAHGVTDSYVIPDGGGDNHVVSLGVFTEISRAGRRREEVRAHGYEPTVTDRTRRGTVYWVDVRLGAGETLDFESMQTPGRILRLEQRSCPL
jgi:hypothetical protein